jgi:ribosomal protein L13E
VDFFITKPIVKRKIRGVKFIRNGRGFSKAELNEVGIINISIAKGSGIPVDLLRKTKNPENCKRYLNITSIVYEDSLIDIGIDVFSCIGTVSITVFVELSITETVLEY